MRASGGNFGSSGFGGRNEVAGNQRGYASVRGHRPVGHVFADGAPGRWFACVLLQKSSKIDNMTVNFENEHDRE